MRYPCCTDDCAAVFKTMDQRLLHIGSVHRGVERCLEEEETEICHYCWCRMTVKQYWRHDCVTMFQEVNNNPSDEDKDVENEGAAEQEEVHGDDCDTNNDDHDEVGATYCDGSEGKEDDALVPLVKKMRDEISTLCSETSEDDDDEEEEEEEEVGKFMCELYNCDKSFMTKLELKMHWRTHSWEDF